MAKDTKSEGQMSKLIFFKTKNKAAQTAETYKKYMALWKKYWNDEHLNSFL